MRRLERTFLDECQRIAAQCRPLGYNPTRFVQMLLRHGGRETARHILKPGPPHDGFATMLMLGRLDLTIEYLAVESRFRELFTDAELHVAEERLGRTEGV